VKAAAPTTPVLKTAACLQTLGWLALLALAVLAPTLLGSYGQGVLLQLYAWIALTASWVAFSGMTGYISLGHVIQCEINQ